MLGFRGEKGGERFLTDDGVMRNESMKLQLGQQQGNQHELKHHLDVVLVVEERRLVLVLWPVFIDFRHGL